MRLATKILKMQRMLSRRISARLVRRRRMRIAGLNPANRKSAVTRASDPLDTRRIVEPPTSRCRT